MNLIKKIFTKVMDRKIIKNTFFRLKGLKTLSSAETIAILKPYCIKTVNESSIDLPDIMDENIPTNQIYKSYNFKSGEVYVWSRDLKNGFIAKHGSVVADGKVYCTDYDHKGFKHEYWKADKRPAKFVDNVIPLLSHHQDMESALVFTGYYDFTLIVAAKLSRIKDALGDEDLKNMFITYCPFGGSYEKQYIELLGFNPGNYIDCRDYKISANKVIFGNCGTWKPNINEILSLKRNVEKKLNITDSTSALNNRIYISRKGRREIENETELIELLKKFDFTIIEDKARTVEEQVHIYRNASFIIGPHGASFANVIWCRPNTHLYELFSTSWYPDYFLFLAKINKMQYSAYRDDTHNHITNNDFAALCQNVYVSIPKLQASLEKIFGTKV